MALNPINYTLPQTNAMQDLLGGYGAMEGLRTSLKARAQEPLIEAKQQAAEAIQAQQLAQQQQQQQASREALGMFGQDPTPDNYRRALLMNPQMADVLKSSYENVSAEKKAETAKFAGEVYSLVSNDRPSDAVALLQQRAIAYRNSGDEESAKETERLAELGKSNPRALRTMAAVILGSNAPDSFDKVYGGLSATRINEEKAPGEIAKNDADINLIGTQIDEIKEKLKIQWAEFGLKEDELDLKIEATAAKIAADANANGGFPKLSAGSEKFAEESAALAVTSAGLAQQAEGLLQQVEQSDLSGGGAAAVKRIWNSAWGDKDVLRAQVARLVNSDVINSLPPGAASDRDIELMRSPMPGDHAGSEEIKAYLSALSRVQRAAAKTAESKNSWVTFNGNMGAANRDMVVGGIEVAAGTTFPQYMRATAKAAASSRNW